jgi:hypothetical protein
MGRLELIVILFLVVLYVWWRVRRRIEQIKARFRQPERPAAETPRAAEAPRALTLEKDPVTGVYRPPKG